MRRISLLAAICLFLTNCQSNTPSTDEESNEPKTFYGETVQRSHELSSEADIRNEEMNKQADTLFNDDI